MPPYNSVSPPSDCFTITSWKRVFAQPILLGEGVTQEITKPLWLWPICLETYDRDPHLSRAEQAVLNELIDRIDAANHHWPPPAKFVLQRLLQPLYDTLATTNAPTTTTNKVVIIMLRGMQRHGSAFWAWTRDEWLEMLSSNNPTFRQRDQATTEIRQY